MLSNKYYNFNKINFLNFLIAIVPLTLILGNLATNINIVLIIFLGFFLYGNKIFIIEKKLIKYFIYSFFFYLIIITFINNWDKIIENSQYKNHIIKSIFFLRFLLFFLVINKLLEKKEFNTKIFFISSFCFSLVISIDIIIQYIFDKNIIGFPIINGRPSSFFYSENIAGGFLQKFSLIAIFYLSVIKKDKIKTDLYILFITLILFFPIILTGNRMPAFMFCSSIFLYFFIEGKIKRLLLSFLLITLIILSLNQLPLKNKLLINIKSFASNSIVLIQNTPKFFLSDPDKPFKSLGSGYMAHFNTGIQIWKEKKILGHGLKSFRLNCSFETNKTCNTHPHNYFIEIMVDMGLVGISIIYFTLIYGIINFIRYYYSVSDIKYKLTSIVFLLLVLVEFFPIRSTGSFFTTNNSTFIFLILPIFFNFEKIKKIL